MSENGPLTTTVEDAALMLAVMSGEPPVDLDAPAGVRIALSVKPPAAGLVVHPALKASVGEAGRFLREHGHTVESAEPRYPLWVALAVNARWPALPARDAAPFLADPGLKARLETGTVRHARAGRIAAAIRPPRASDRERFRAAPAPFFERYDVLIMPTPAQPAPPARRWGEGSWLRSFVTSGRYAPMTVAWNLAGYPAATVPMGTGPKGLPTAVQLVGRPAGEPLLLAIAAQLQRSNPWPRHAPAYRTP
ncbi:amidase family protein [Embleya sp. NBC_00888]|uniref:amidase family protein n=1 Tax=Embleya sp. NBC_00888 TaxID=2975960 RepID=UPI002F913553